MLLNCELMLNLSSYLRRGWSTSELARGGRIVVAIYWVILVAKYHEQVRKTGASGTKGWRAVVHDLMECRDRADRGGFPDSGAEHAGAIELLFKGCGGGWSSVVVCTDIEPSFTKGSAQSCTTRSKIASELRLVARISTFGGL